MDQMMNDLAQKLGECFAESTASVFSMLTGRDFTIHPGPGELMEHADIADKLPAGSIFVKAPYAKGVTGTLFFSMPLRESTILVDLMLGGDGAPSDSLAGDSKDALSETFNQVMGSANQTLSDQAGETLSITGLEILEVESFDAASIEKTLGQGNFLTIPLATTQDTLQTNIYLLSSSILYEQLKRKLGLTPQEITPQPIADASASAGGAQSFQQTAPIPTYESNVDTRNLDLLLDIELPVVVRMGHTEMPLGELLKLVPGSILELNRPADAPVDLLVNGKQIAKGEVVVVDGNFAFRITEIETTAQRLQNLS
ncbi:MAG: flagellar motor switch protein FliN [Holophagales bacterium]|jgi:flagellar motor switch protein FliN/FliY|nr:flagellar motor switch protein FliN [Holophagales bacterium]